MDQPKGLRRDYSEPLPMCHACLLACCNMARWRCSITVGVLPRTPEVASLCSARMYIPTCNLKRSRLAVLYRPPHGLFFFLFFIYLGISFFLSSCCCCCPSISFRVLCLASLPHLSVFPSSLLLHWTAPCCRKNKTRWQISRR